MLAGILGSVVTYGYGPEGAAGANYMQSMAACGGRDCPGWRCWCRRMVWLHLPQPPTWELILFFMCIGMFPASAWECYSTPICFGGPNAVDVSLGSRRSQHPPRTDRPATTPPVHRKILGGGTLAGIVCGVAAS